MRHGPSQRDLAAVLQPDRETAREFAISHGSPSALNSRRLSETRGASCLFGRLQWEAAGRAARLAEELDLFPAIGTEAVDVADDRSAAGAPRRKREIERPSRACAQHFAGP